MFDPALTAGLVFVGGFFILAYIAEWIVNRIQGRK